MWVVSPLLIILAGILNSIMDVLKDRWSNSIFKDWKGQNWINPSISWHTKWELDKKIFGRQINIVDKIFSTTLVWITDMWHFSKMLMLVSISLSIVFYTPIFSFFLWDALLFYILFTITFEIFFSKILIKKPE